MITPSDTPSSPEDYDQVPVSQFDILDGQAATQAEVETALHAATAVAGAGVLYPKGPRQADTERLIESPPGYGEFTITPGFHGSGDDTWSDPA